MVNGWPLDSAVITTGGSVMVMPVATAGAGGGGGGGNTGRGGYRQNRVRDGELSSGHNPNPH